MQNKQIILAPYMKENFSPNINTVTVKFLSGNVQVLSKPLLMCFRERISETNLAEKELSIVATILSFSEESLFFNNHSQDAFPLFLMTKY